MEYLNSVDIKNCVGEVYITKCGHNFKVVKYSNSRDVLIEFLESGYLKVCQMKEVRTGSIKDPSQPSLYGVGVLGSAYKTKILNNEGKYVEVLQYSTWSGMIERCYSARFLKKRPTYVGCKASYNFKHYEYFYKWCSHQIGFDQEGWHLDKDLLVKGNKLYSENTCVFLPPEINNALCKNGKLRGSLPIGVHFCNKRSTFIAQINRGKGSQELLGKFSTPEGGFLAYKEAKEVYLKQLANKWKEHIDPRAYEALMNYQVEITD